MKLILGLIFIALFTTASAQRPIRAVKVTELADTIKNSRGPLIVNFWATFCIPCLQEIPYFQELAGKYKSRGVSIIFVSLDLKKEFPDSINSTARRHHIDEPIVWLDETNADYFCPKVDSSWTGGMPSSLFINNSTGYHKFFEEQLSREKLEAEILKMLPSGKSN